MLLVKFAEGTHAMWAEKFLRIEHAPEQAFHAVAARERDEAALAGARFMPAGDQRREIRTILEVPFKTCFETGRAFQQFRLDRFDRKKRDQPHDRTDAQPLVPAIR